MLSSLLFNVFSEVVMSKALGNLEAGVKINGKVLNSLRYADDAILVAASETISKAIVNKVYE